MKPLATIERVRETLDYNPETGGFVWKERSVKTKYDKIWNKRFSGKPTGHKSDIHGFLCIQICLDNKLYRAHRLAWAHFYGVWPNAEIDHINLDPCDNRIVNLRDADRSQNECNKTVRSDNKIGIKGVHYDNERKKWQMQIKFKDKKLMKRFDTLEEAKIAYQEAAIELHGDFRKVA